MKPALPLLLIVAACGQPQGMATPAPRIDRIRVESQNIDYEIASTPQGSEVRSTLKLPVAAVWEALPRAYADLEIPIETYDPAHRFLAGVVSAHRAFADRSLSHFVNCGSTLMGPNADSYNVRLHFQTEVDSVNAGEAKVRTLVNATAASDGGITVQCSSRGDLERLIGDRVAELLTPKK